MKTTAIRVALGAIACLLGLSAAAQTNPSDVNVALQANGGWASASSVYNPSWPIDAVNNNERAGYAAGQGSWQGGVWIDGSADVYPDWVQIDFNGVKAVDKVVVYSMQDNYLNPVEPTDTMTFSLYGLTDFTVQGWNGTAWQVLATVAGNNLVKRTVTFTAFNTTKIRINITGALNHRSRMTELEAWGVDGTWSLPWAKNVALASTGATAFASSQYNSVFPVSSIIDGEFNGRHWAGGGGWADFTPDVFPDWVEVDFPSPQTIDHIVLYTLRDDWQQNGNYPTDTTTFTQYGITDFVVQVWDGINWNGVVTVTGNNVVKRTVQLPVPYTTSKIRILVTGAMASFSRIVELQAWVLGNAPPPTSWVNVALASNGGVATASSQYSPDYPVSAVNDGQATNVAWSHGGGWADGTPGQFPDWVQIAFNGIKTIDHVVVYGLRDNWDPSVAYPAIGDGSICTYFCLTDYDVQAWDGTRWLTLAAVRGNTQVKNTLYFAAFSASKIRVNVLNTTDGLSRIVEIEAWSPSPTPYSVTRQNWALATSGGSAAASSTYGSYAASKLIDGERAGTGWVSGGGWADGTPGTFPDWAEVDFNAPKVIDQVVLYTVQDNYQAPVEPTDTTTFTLYGIVDFDVQAWDGAQWNTVASVTGNNLVKRTVTFPAIATTKIRAVIRNALGGFSRLTEIEAWGYADTNHAAQANGATASASSVYGEGFAASATIDGERKGLNWGAGGGWADGTMNVYPDWVQIDFGGMRTLNWVNVYTLQDNWQSPVEPTDAMTFSQYGVQDYTVQAWTGSQWQTVATVTGNTFVKRGVALPSVQTSSIRVNVNASLNYLSRVTEIEAWGDPLPVVPPAPPPAGTIVDFTMPAMLAFTTVPLASGAVGAGLLDPSIPPSYGSERVQIVQTTTSPVDGIWEMTISPTKGVIDSNAGPCYATGSASGSMGFVEWTPAGTSSPYPICFVNTGAPAYVNVRYTYSTGGCPWGTCAYVIEPSPGYLPPP